MRLLSVEVICSTSFFFWVFIKVWDFDSSPIEEEEDGGKLLYEDEDEEDVVVSGVGADEGLAFLTPVFRKRLDIMLF